MLQQSDHFRVTEIELEVQCIHKFDLTKTMVPDDETCCVTEIGLERGALTNILLHAAGSWKLSAVWRLPRERAADPKGENAVSDCTHFPTQRRIAEVKEDRAAPIAVVHFLIAECSYSALSPMPAILNRLSKFIVCNQQQRSAEVKEDGCANSVRHIWGLHFFQFLSFAPYRLCRRCLLQQRTAEVREDERESVVHVCQVERGQGCRVGFIFQHATHCGGEG